jgi:hypothetical protein
MERIKKGTKRTNRHRFPKTERVGRPSKTKVKSPTLARTNGEGWASRLPYHFSTSPVSALIRHWLNHQRKTFTIKIAIQ